ncbi:MAG: Cna B-type domain-containing protein, partial [Streptococcaceae bacterium]|nr:Cna B-type domain-containing protein [Streptococcaceae bacterium]
MIKTRKRVIISGMIFIILMGILAVFISYSLEKRAQGVSIDSTSDVSAGATRIDREDFNAHFTLGGAVGQRYLDGGAFNPMGPALTDEQTKAKYDESTGIITLTPNRNDWAGNFTLNDRISTQQPFVLKGAVYLGDRTDSDWRDADWGANGGTPSGGADGIGFAFHPEDVGHVGFTGANLGIGGLKGAIGYKFDTYWNTPQQSDADDNHRLGWDADPGNKGAHTGNPFGAFVETTSSPIPAGQPLLDSGRNAPFNTEAGFAVADWNQIAWFDTSKLLQSSGDNRREEIGDPYQGTERRTVDNYGYDANENKPANERDNTRGFIDVIYKYEPNSLQNGHGLLKVYMAQGYVVNANSANTITQEDKVYDLLGQKEITSSDSLALAVSASTGAFRNLQQFRFDYFEYSGVKRLSIDKKWDDNANYMGMRPDEIKVQLWASLEATNELPAVRQPYKEPVSISAANDWHYMVDNLPQYNDQGREIFYDVTELPVSGYQSHVQDITATGDHSDLQFEIDNSLANPLTLSGGKIWLDDGAVDSRPSQISVQLWRNDNGVERQVKFGEL